MPRGRMRVPHCVGEYEAGDTSCDGQPDGATRADQAVCAWRDRCSAFQQYLISVDGDVEDHVEIRKELDPDGDERFYGVPLEGYAKFLKLCDTEIRRWKVSRGHPQRSPKHFARNYRAPAKWLQKKARKALDARQAARRNEAMKLVEHFKEQLLDELPGYNFAGKRAIIRPGHLYMVDRRRSSKYLACYCRTGDGRDVPIALLIPRPATLTLDLALPVPITGYGAFGVDFVRRLDAQDHPGKSRFKSVVKRADKERIAMAAEVIGRLHERGELLLPSPPAR